MPIGAAIAAPPSQFPSSPTPPRLHRRLRNGKFASLSSSFVPSHLYSGTRRRPAVPPLSEAESIVRSGASRWRTGATSSFSGGGGLEGSAARDVPGQLGVDELLSVAEVLCLAPPILYSIGCLASFVVPGASKQFQLTLGSKLFAVQYFLLVGAVAIGGWVRWRQWQRICKVNEDGTDVNLIGRIEKVEEDLRSSATIVRVLSRQLEKLGIRFRVTRKTLKEPITETAALAQKNSEVTHALAIKEDILEKELEEIQKVLLAMQEQQKKQLDLILAIGKAGGVLDSRQDSLKEHGRFSPGNSVPEGIKSKGA